MDAKENGDYGELLQSLENVVMDLNDMENMIDNFQDSTAEPLFAKVNDYVRGLKEVQQLAPTCNLEVPHEALERMDNDLDQNPEVFTQELLNRCKDEFGQLNARVQGIRTVRQRVAEGWRDKGQAGSENTEGRGRDGGASSEQLLGGASESVATGGGTAGLSSQGVRKGGPKSPGRGVGGGQRAASAPRR